MSTSRSLPLFFFFNDTATTEIYTLSLHDALPISRTEFRRRGSSSWHAPGAAPSSSVRPGKHGRTSIAPADAAGQRARSEEHTSELQSHLNLVCRLLLEKKKKHHVTAYADLFAIVS